MDHLLYGRDGLRVEFVEAELPFITDRFGASNNKHTPDGTRQETRARPFRRQNASPERQPQEIRRVLAPGAAPLEMPISDFSLKNGPFLFV
jgi:hypothetical protein